MRIHERNLPDRQVFDLPVHEVKEGMEEIRIKEDKEESATEDQAMTKTIDYIKENEPENEEMYLDTYDILIEKRRKISSIHLSSNSER